MALEHLLGKGTGRQRMRVEDLELVGVQAAMELEGGK
jgi:hypothetical protein